MRKFFIFEGRINRQNYFFINLFLGLVWNVILVIDPDSALGGIIALSILFCCTWINICSIVKRFHDLNMSGENLWRLFIPIYNIYIGIMLLFKKGTTGTNTYGEDPLRDQKVFEDQVEENELTKQAERGVSTSSNTYENRANIAEHNDVAENCMHCGGEIEEGSIFCEFCGVKIEESKQEKDTEIKNKNIKQIVNYLEFLDYKIKCLESKEGKDLVFAKHSENKEIIIWELYPNFTLFRCNIAIIKEHNTEIDRFINEVNNQLDVARAFIEGRDGVAELGLEAIYTGKYEKEIFGQFYNIFHRDQNSVVSFENFDKLFKD